MARKTSVPARLYVLAGVNGAGKSSIGGAAIRAAGGNYFNPDEAARELIAANPGLGQTDANAAACQHGFRITRIGRCRSRSRAGPPSSLRPGSAGFARPPAMSQFIQTVPALRHKISAVPSPSKSPTPATLQAPAEPSRAVNPE